VAVLKFFPIQVKALAASFRDPRSHPFDRMTPPMSQNNVVISAKGATPPVNTFIFRPYYAISEHVKGPKIYGAAKCLFLSALLRMVSNCIRPYSAPHDRCNRITGLRRRPRDSKSPCPSAICNCPKE